MNIVESRGDDALARVFVARLEDGAMIELAESVQPPIPRAQKWVLIVSTLRGCPISCAICDAGGEYKGPLSAAEILAQIDYLVKLRFPDRVVPTPKLKVQFARMGEPAFNDAVLEVLQRLPTHLQAPGLMPCLSTIAPKGREAFFEALIGIKNAHYAGGRFQMQFSLHTTCETARRALVPARTWSFAQMAAWGERFFTPGDRKITLNFAPAAGLPLEPEALRASFDPAVFMVKLTPINPTFSASAAGLEGLLNPERPELCEAVAEGFRRAGFETISSIGEVDENRIGSNCGMRVRAL